MELSIISLHLIKQLFQWHSTFQAILTASTLDSKDWTFWIFITAPIHIWEVIWISEIKKYGNMFYILHYFVIFSDIKYLKASNFFIPLNLSTTLLSLRFYFTVSLAVTVLYRRKFSIKSKLLRTYWNTVWILQ